MGGVVVRTLEPAEVTNLVGWAAGEGWNPGLGDAEAFRAADPDGFIGCFVNGELAAGIAAIAYDTSFGFIGLYICRPMFRGQGFGRRVWDAGMSYLGDRVIGLDGVPEQQGNYASMGFAPLYETVRWSGVAPKSMATPQSVRLATDDDLAALAQLDRRHFPADRTGFLKTWLAAPRSAFVREAHGQITGFAVVRDCGDGAKIGPLFATDEDTAEDLFAACLASRPDSLLAIDVPQHQVGFAETLEHAGFAPGFTTARMYRGKAPVVALAGVYGVTTLELG
ncbi:GNAT family N-acetyltransferase [Ciceribacter sp. L1K23]|uniref:GNAT family N-acetyltransferase n=1 Tax=Ciceribacter sp. L1K23 TaxID=2820276 RepID=UPI001B83D1B2|nr:GNAT family N-acetyltransferase [Ciceribacter sp. L1K23]MBR0556280.1 GNAT family N-acetyltransferase [Ciceribacter sp. L1K23]